MNAYVERVIEYVKKRHGNEPEFCQTVEEVFSSFLQVFLHYLCQKNAFLFIGKILWFVFGHFDIFPPRINGKC